MQKDTYTMLLEECIKNQLLPVYKMYYESQGVEPPILSVPLKCDKNKTVAALLKPNKDQGF